MPTARTAGKLAKLDAVNARLARCRDQEQGLELSRALLVEDLVEHDGLSQRAVARHLGMSPSAISHQLMRAAASRDSNGATP